MALHELTAPDSILSPLQYANSITDQWFGGFIILFIFFITFTGLKMYKTESAFLVASIISFLVTVLLIPLSIVSPIMLGFPILMVIVSLFMTYISG